MWSRESRAEFAEGLRRLEMKAAEVRALLNVAPDSLTQDDALRHCEEIDEALGRMEFGATLEIVPDDEG